MHREAPSMVTVLLTSNPQSASIVELTLCVLCSVAVAALFSLSFKAKRVVIFDWGECVIGVFLRIHHFYRDGVLLSLLYHLSHHL